MLETLRKAVGRLTPKQTWRRVVAVALLLSLGALSVLHWTIGRSAKLQPTRPADCVIVLGAGYNGTPPNVTPKKVYRNRLKHGRDLFNRGMAAHIIVTELAPAAGAARDYLVSEGIPESAISVEGRSISTWENLGSSQEIMREHGWESAIVVSDGFHMYRAMRMCRDLELDAEGAATPYSEIDRVWYKRIRWTLSECTGYAGHILGFRKVSRE